MLWQEPPSGAQSAGTGGIEVSLGLIGGAPGSEVRAVEDIPEADMVDAPVEPVSEPDVPTEVQAVEPPPEAVPEDIVETVDVVEIAEPIEMAEVKEVLEAKADIPPPPPPKPPEPQRLQVVEPPRPEASAQEPPPEVVETVEPAETQTASLPPATSGSDGKAGTENSSEAGSAKSESGGGLPGSTADYIATLQTWLARHKEYPRYAQ